MAILRKVKLFHTWFLALNYIFCIQTLIIRKSSGHLTVDHFDFQTVYKRDQFFVGLKTFGTCIKS